jgi:lysyl-tRNA synthetase class 2
VAERFELYVGGLELANGFSELVDPEEQRRRFEKEMRTAEEWVSPFMLCLKNFRGTERDASTAGIALGIDRLVMIFLDAPSIDEVVAFTPEEL